MALDAAITASSYVLGCIVDKEKNFKTSELISQIGASVISSCLADCEFSDAKTIDRKMKQSKAVITRGTNKKMMKKANYMIKNCHKDIKNGIYSAARSVAIASTSQWPTIIFSRVHRTLNRGADRL